MEYLRKLPPWLALAVGIFFVISPSSSFALQSAPASFYDWGNYYQPKVLGFSVYAQEVAVPVELPAGISIPEHSYLLPSSRFYFTKTVFEGLQNAVTFDAVSQQERYLEQAEERLAESFALLENGEADLALRTADRYFEQVEVLSENVEELMVSGKNILAFAQQVEKQGVEASLIIRATQTDPRNREIVGELLSGSHKLIDTSSTLQDEPVVPSDLSNSIQALKNQGLLTVEESNKIYGLGSRSEVREELDKLISEGLFPQAELATLDEPVKNLFPQEYQGYFERAKYAELRYYESFARPDEETGARLSEFGANYKAGDPVPGELKSYLYILRADNLASNIDLGLIGSNAEDELLRFYPGAIARNETANPDKLKLEEAVSQLVPKPPVETGQEPDSSKSEPETKPPVEAEEDLAGGTGAKSEEFATPSAGLYIGELDSNVPGTRFYFLKTFGETFDNITTFDKKERFNLKLRHSEERLREAQALLEAGKSELGLQSLEKYSESMAEISEDFRALDGSSRDAKVLGARFEEGAARHNILFEKGFLPIPQDGRDELQKAIVATQNAQDVSADLQGRAALPAALVDRLQDLKNGGLLIDEEVDKISQADSRQKVREIFRDLEEKGVLPSSDSKKLDSGQQNLFGEEFNKLVEVRKIEELARLRTVQDAIGKTQKLRADAENYKVKIESLENSLNPALISTVDLFVSEDIEARAKEYASDYSASVDLPEATTLFAQPSFVLPGSRLYFLKGWGENFAELTAIGAEAKQKVRLSRAQERLAEARALLEAGREESAQEALERYQVDMRATIEGVKGLPSAQRDEVGQLLEQTAARDNLALSQLSLGVSDHAEGVINVAINLTENALDMAADIEGKGAIPPEIVEKINSLPSEMMPDEKKQEVLGVSTRSEGREKIENLVAGGLLVADDYQVYNTPILEFDPVSFRIAEELLKVDQIVGSEESRKELIDTAEKNEEVVKALAEFKANFKVGDEVPSEIRPYVPLTRIDELTNTIRPDILTLSDFSRRPDVVLAIATLREEFKPTIDDYRRIEEFRKTKPGAVLPPDLARIEALSFGLGIKVGTGPCYLPSPPFPASSPCPSVGAPIPISPTINYSLASNQVAQIYGQGPATTAAGICPEGFHWMGDSGGWCMSNSGVYGTSSSSGPIPGDSFDWSPTGSIRNGTYIPYTQTTYNNQSYQSPASNASFTALYSPYETVGGQSTYGQGPASVADGKCPEGFHWMSDSGGWCMSNGVNYSQVEQAAAYQGSQTGGTAPASGPITNYSTYNTYGTGAPYYWGPAPTSYNTSGGTGGSSYGSGPPPVSPGVCQPGYHWMFDNGGWCMSDGPTYTAPSATSPYPAYSSGSGSYYSCSTGYYWNGSSCVYSGGTYSGGSGSGSGYTGTSYGSCGSGYYWNGSSCVPSSSGTYSSGSTSTTGSCPSGYHWMSDSGGWCMSDGGSSGTSSSGTSSSPSTSTGSCPSGYHWMSDSGGWCMSDGGSSSQPVPSSAPASSPAPAPAQSSEPAPAPAQSSEPAPAPAPSP